jgi:hypothetical protein
MIAFFLCLFGSHPHRFRSRDEEGRLTLQCVQCGHQVLVLPEQVLKVKPQEKPRSSKSLRFPRSA